MCVGVGLCVCVCMGGGGGVVLLSNNLNVLNSTGLLLVT